MNKKTKDIIVGAVVTLLIVTLLGGFIISYLSSSPAILFSTEGCDSYFEDKETNYNFQVQNRAENIGLAQVCYHSDEIFFKQDGNLVHDYCFPEAKVKPKSSDLISIFSPQILPHKSELQDGDNATIKISVECSQKIWSLLRRNCDNLFFECNYKKQGSSYRLVSS